MKKILSSLFISTLLLGGTIQVAEAETVPTETSEASISFSEGALRLEPVNDLNFGDYTIGSTLENENTYSSTNSQMATVADFRGLADGNWSLNASISGFTDEENNETLTGFNLQFNGESATADNTLNKLSGPSAADTPNLNYVASENNSVNFLSATDGNGRGSWTATWSNVALFIPEGSETVGDHTAAITWELLDAPQ